MKFHNCYNNNAEKLDQIWIYLAHKTSPKMGVALLQILEEEEKR